MAPKDPRNNQLRKAVLIPLWVMQCPLLCFFLVNTSLGVHTYTTLWIFGLFLAFFMAGSTLCNVVEIILFAKHKLRPTLYLVMQIVKATIWLVLWVISLIPNAGGPAGVIVTSSLLAVFLGSLAYASVIVHRQRHLQRSPFLFNPAYQKPAYPRRVSKDSIFGDQVDLMRPASVQLSRLDRRYRDVGA